MKPPPRSKEKAIDSSPGFQHGSDYITASALGRDREYRCRILRPADVRDTEAAVD